MIPVNGAIDAIFLGCLLFGVMFTLVAAVFGGLDLGLDGDVGDLSGASWLGNASGMLAFVAWFGGIGLLAHEAAGLPLFVSLIVAVIGGAGGGYAVGRAVRGLSGSGDVLDPRAYELPGTIGRVVSSIRPNGTGEIVYEQAGSRQVAAARAEHGSAIPRGTDVVVLQQKGGILTVAPWDDLLERKPRAVQES